MDKKYEEILLDINCRSNQLGTFDCKEHRVKQHKKILIVDDNAATADSFRDILELFGYHAQCVYDGEKVLNLLSEQQFDIVFMDINLKNMSGITLLKNIKSSSTKLYENTKFIAVSGYSQQDSIGAQAAVVFDFYIQKPIDLDNLETLLASINA